MAQFETAAQHLRANFRDEFHALRQSLKDAYAALDPDTDTRSVGAHPPAEDTGELRERLVEILERANYDRVSERDLQRALRASSLFQVRLHVDLDDFAELLLYTRGASRREEQVRELFGLWRRTVRFTNYDRVLLYLRLKPDLDESSTLGDCPAGSTLLKLFQNVPEADIEMLFPNIRVGMRMLDKLLIGVPALVSGGIALTTKVGTTLLLLGSLIGFWLGLSSQPVTLDKPMLIALGAGLAALGGYLWKQFANFRNRKLRYTQALTENLYFKLLDNNTGALLRILDDAEDAECKESVLACYFLLAHGAPMTAPALDAAIEDWFAEQLQCRLDFEIDDALGKLQRLGLASCEGEHWRAAPRRGTSSGEKPEPPG
ncbi:DUF3754 domain-containing protein [Mangrovimicrobium sediminis]|uniref:DUF3754 domain-containing protein n=2 Tax=Mangrovimicrobium sediminis TaxID=2562682 RepID=A0A4Z0LZX9_9GAMM|nr:DUF3754 domain-containing protein [Haliea sp. SAOS-164]